MDRSSRLCTLPSLRIPVCALDKLPTHSRQAARTATTSHPNQATMTRLSGEPEGRRRSIFGRICRHATSYRRRPGRLATGTPEVKCAINAVIVHLHQIRNMGPHRGADRGGSRICPFAEQLSNAPVSPYFLGSARALWPGMRSGGGTVGGVVPVSSGNGPTFSFGRIPAVYAATAKKSAGGWHRIFVFVPGLCRILCHPVLSATYYYYYYY